MNNAKIIQVLVIFFLSMLGLVFAGNFLMQLMAYATMVLWFIAGVSVTGAIGYGGYKLLQKRDNGIGGIKLIARNYRVHDNARRHVYLFRSEPSLQELGKIGDELQIAQLELRGEVFPLLNDEHVEVVEDNGKESIKVRVKNPGKNGGIDQEGWVPRSALVKE